MYERGAFSSFVEVLAKYKGKIEGRGVVHNFIGTKEEAEVYVNMGLYIGVTGWVCDEKRNVAAFSAIPLDRILIEVRDS